MVKQWSMSGSLFLFVRTYRQLEYYFKLKDALLAANQSGIDGASEVSTESPNVFEIHPLALARVRFSHHPG